MAQRKLLMLSLSKHALRRSETPLEAGDGSYAIALHDSGRGLG